MLLFPFLPFLFPSLSGGVFLCNLIELSHTVCNVVLSCESIAILSHSLDILTSLTTSQAPVLALIKKQLPFTRVLMFYSLFRFTSISDKLIQRLPVLMNKDQLICHCVRLLCALIGNGIGVCAINKQLKNRTYNVTKWPDEVGVIYYVVQLILYSY